MYLTNVDNKYTRWLNSLPAAENKAGKGDIKQNMVTVGNNSPFPGNSSVVPDKILYSGEKVQSSIKNYSGLPITEYELFPSSEREYTVQDAIEYQYNKQFTIKLDDLMSGNYENIKLRDPGQPVPKEFTEGLQRNGIQEEEYDWFRADFYIGGLSDISDIKHAVQYLASGFAVARQHIEELSAGRQRAEQLEQLENTFREAMEKKAGETADELGGFFEENGVDGERQKIYDSIMKAYSDSVQEYSGFIEHNKDYADLEGTDNSWLKKDDSYMACRLRKSMAPAGETAVRDSGQYYTLDDLGKTKNMVDEIKRYLPGSGGERSINVSLSEEEIGIRLTELSLKGRIFEKYSDVCQGLKNAVTVSIGNMVRNIPDRLDEILNKEGRGGGLERESIRSVYLEAMSVYHGIRDVVNALRTAVAAGKKQYEEKVNDGLHTGTWNYGKNGYDRWIHSFSAMSESWNQFVMKYSGDAGLLLSSESFSSYA